MNPLILALAALSSAAAVPRSTTSYDYTMYMKVDDEWRTVNAVGDTSYSYPDGMLYLAAKPKDKYSGTPVIVGGNSTNTALAFDITGTQPLTNISSGLWGIFVGDDYDFLGDYVPAYAQLGLTYNGFEFAGGRVYNELTDPDDLWLACDKKIDDTEYTILGWGIMAENGSYPYGCQYSEVKLELRS